MGINWKRKAIHVLSAIGFFLICQYRPTLVGRVLLLTFFLVLTWEIIRLKLPKYLPGKDLWLGLLKREERGTLSDATFFLLGLWGASLIVEGEAFGVLILILGFADLTAEIVGRTVGRFRLHNGKSLEGALAFFVITSFLLYGMLSLGTLKTAIVSFALTLTELLTVRDNLWIPLVGAFFLKMMV
ncbi:MAG: hypothetical protein N2Z40_01930 [Caldimicrobium sp.]|nr:hypothetical protein [Caldimicrobium sp.]MCX7612970.1 hypothetical protein [Caldimicrobium sp.]MDW8183209.1 hypothetical protein [Caldimicrobium sp.]